jgi:hypothetical protein
VSGTDSSLGKSGTRLSDDGGLRLVCPTTQWSLFTQQSVHDVREIANDASVDLSPSRECREMAWNSLGLREMGIILENHDFVAIHG